MAKHVVFQATDLDDSDDVKDTVLWNATFKIHPTIEPTLPEEMLALVKNKSTIAYPLAYWKKELENLGFTCRFDYPYCKEFTWDFMMDEAIILTIKAKDLNTEHRSIIVPKHLAKQIMDEISLPLFGKMHPEKFHKRLVDYIDLSQTNESLVDTIFEILFELELLCTECIAYESFVEWKVK